MNSNELARTCIVCIYLGLFSDQLPAAGEYFPEPSSGFPGEAHPAPGSIDGSDYRGGPLSPLPLYGAGNARQSPPPNGWRFPVGPAEGVLPSVTVRVSEAIPYVRQSVLLTVRVVSSGNVLTLAPEAPVLETALVEPLDGPRQVPLKSAGWVTEYDYALTPLVPGDVEIPPVTVRATLAHPGARAAYPGQRMPAARELEISSRGTQHLTARSAEPGVNPWLALRELRLRVRVLSEGPYEVGHPVAVELDAIGAGTTGQALPSLRGYLDNPQFKVYPEGVTTLSRLSADGMLLGRRTEKFALVPQQSGDLRLRAMPVSWWNVAAGIADRSILAGYTLPVQGSAPTGRGRDSNGFTLLPHYSTEHLIDGFWLPAAVVGLLGAFWLGVWSRSRRLPARFGAWLRARGTQVTGGMNGLLRHLVRYSPVTPYRRLRHRLMLAMPAAFKLRYCLRKIDCEQQPTEWCQLFQILVYKYLNIPVNVPLADIVEAMIQRNPRLDAGKLRRLVEDLDGTRYGRRSLDFVAWKKSFRRRLCPWGLACRAPHRPPPASAIPGLNPDPS